MEQFIIDERYISRKIRKSTFKVNNAPVNAFIDPYGRICQIETMHHNQWALQELKRENKAKASLIRGLKNDVSKCEKQINILKNLKPGDKYVGPRLDWYVVDCLKEGSKKGINNAIKRIEGVLKSYKRRVEFETKEESLICRFDKAHKALGLDPAEFLVAEMGYCAIENSYLIYGNNISYSFLDAFDLVSDHDYDNGDVFFVRPRNDKELAKIRRGLVEKASYYSSDPSARFHCPSGFIRRDYEKFLSDCRKYGVDYSPRSSYRYFT